MDPTPKAPVSVAPSPASAPPPEPPPGARTRARLLFAGIGLVAAVADVATKVLAFSALGGVAANGRLAVPGRQVTVIPGLFDLTCSVNTGAVFGLFSGQLGGVIGLTLLALGLIAWILLKAPPRAGMHAAFGLVFGGALGNLWDRLWFGGVRDFLDVHWERDFTWPTFNLADAWIVVGIALVLLLEWRAPKPAPPGTPGPAGPTGTTG
ncbi:MAG: signal peptidase II [Planctomycetales bacterium]|nr:signal peptidase II [Planctomycetales bacterium]